MFHLGSIQVLNNNSKTFRDGGSLYNDKNWHNQYIPCLTHTHTHTHASTLCRREYFFFIVFCSMPTVATIVRHTTIQLRFLFYHSSFSSFIVNICIYFRLPSIITSKKLTKHGRQYVVVRTDGTRLWSIYS